jgi:hypothetical protein
LFCSHALFPSQNNIFWWLRTLFFICITDLLSLLSITHVAFAHLVTLRALPAITMSTSVPIIGPMQPPPRSVLLITDEIQKTIEYAAFQPDFYKLPADAVAHFSTNLGKQQKREVADPPPAPVVRSNVDDEIRRKAIELREQCPSIARRVTFPVSKSFTLQMHTSRLSTDLVQLGLTYTTSSMATTSGSKVQLSSFSSSIS